MEPTVVDNCPSVVSDGSVSVSDPPPTVSVVENSEQKTKKVEPELKERTNYKGVFKCGKKFKAQIQTNRVQHYLGLFDTEIEAARAYDNHARVVLGPRARTNFDYSSSVMPGAVQVAPLFSRAESKSSQGTVEGQEPTLPPKRTYVGIKLKRQAMSGLPPAIIEDKRQKIEGGDSRSAQSNAGNGTSGAYAPFPSLSVPGLSTTAQGMMLPPNLSAGPPGPFVSPEEQLRWYEQFYQMQCMQNTAALYFNPQHPAAQQSGAPFPGQPFPGFNPYLMNMAMGMNMPNMPYGGGISSADAAAPYNLMAEMAKYSGSGTQGQFDPFRNFQPSTTPGQFPGAGMGGMGSMGSLGAAMHGGFYPNPLGGGMYPMSSHHGPVDMSSLLIPAPSQASSTGTGSGSSNEAAIAALTATMSQANDDDNGATRTGRTGPITGMSQAAIGAASSAMGHLLTLSEAVSSLPGSYTGTPDAAAAQQHHSQSSARTAASVGGSQGSNSDLERTSQLLAAASAVLHGSDARPRRNASTASTRSSHVSDPGTVEDDEPDWRDQLYYWTGVLYYDPARRQQVWKGSWVGSFAGKPLPEEFAESSNHFEYAMNVRSAKQVVRSDGGFAPQSGHWTGHYLMDNNGTGALERYEDTSYEVKFEPERSGGGGNKYAVYGKGDSDFGAFIVTGHFYQQSRVLEMTRQYLIDTDPRAAMTLEEFAQSCKRHNQSPLTAKIEKAPGTKLFKDCGSVGELMKEVVNSSNQATSQSKVEKRVIYKPKERENFKGVFKCGKKFKAQIQINRVRHYLGLFDTELQAAQAYDAYAKKVLGQKARLNIASDPNDDKPNTSSQAVHVPYPVMPYGFPSGYMADGRMMVPTIIPGAPGMQPTVLYQVYPPQYTYQGPSTGVPAVSPANATTGAPSNVAQSSNSSATSGAVKPEGAPNTIPGTLPSATVQEHLRYFDQYQHTHGYAFGPPQAPASSMQQYMAAAAAHPAYAHYPPSYPAGMSGAQYYMPLSSTQQQQPPQQPYQVPPPTSSAAVPQFAASAFYAGAENVVRQQGQQQVDGTQPTAVDGK